MVQTKQIGREDLPHNYKDLAGVLESCPVYAGAVFLRPLEDSDQSLKLALNTNKLVHKIKSGSVWIGC